MAMCSHLGLCRRCRPPRSCTKGWGLRVGGWVGARGPEGARGGQMEWLVLMIRTFTLCSPCGCPDLRPSPAAHAHACMHHAWASPLASIPARLASGGLGRRGSRARRSRDAPSARLQTLPWRCSQSRPGSGSRGAAHNGLVVHCTIAAAAAAWQLRRLKAWQTTAFPPSPCPPAAAEVILGPSAAAASRGGGRSACVQADGADDQAGAR